MRVWPLLLILGSLTTLGDEQRCGDVLPTSEESRALVVMTADTVTLALLQPRQNTILCNGYATFVLRVTAGKGTRVTVSDDAEHQWNFRPLEAMDVRVRPGTYRLIVEKPHFLRFQKTFVVDLDAKKTLVASVKPLPKLSGTVVARDANQPLGGAILTTNVDAMAIADVAGRFAIEADPENWPKYLSISAAGYSETSVGVPAARVSATLEPIYLNRGGTIAVDIVETNTGEVQEIDLLELVDRGHSLGRTVKSLPVEKNEAHPLRFENVEPGSYVVMAKGDESWKRLGEIVEVRAGEATTTTLRINPFSLHVKTRMNGDTLPDAEVRIQNRETRWEGRFKTSDTGERTLELWQGGRMTVMLHSAGTMPHVERRTLSDGEDADWSLDIPAREITGIVVDAATNKPIAGAAVYLHVTSVDRYGLGVQTKTDEKGAFRFAPVSYGKHTVTAAARDYPPTETSYVFLEPEETRALTIRLDAASPSRVAIVDARGTPLAGARVIDFRGLNPIGQSTTDSSGTATLMIPDGEIHDAYVIPRDGSFGFFHARSDMKNATVHVPDGSSRIILQTQSEAKEPIPYVSVVIRHNGRVLPADVINALALQGSRIASGTDGRIVLDHMPAGVYEFWPVGSPAELQALAAGVGPAAPVRIMAAPGENRATLTFAAAVKP
jgi:hypothetical protein